MEKLSKITRGRPPLIQRPVEKTVSLPQPLVTRIDLELFSPLEGRVPHGAWSKFIIRLLETHLNNLDGQDML